MLDKIRVILKKIRAVLSKIRAVIFKIRAVILKTRAVLFEIRVILNKIALNLVHLKAISTKIILKLARLISEGAMGGVVFPDTRCSGKRVDQSFNLFREIVEVGRDA